MKNKILCFFILVIIAMSGSAVHAQEKKAEGDDAKMMEVIKDIYKMLDIGVQIFMDWTMKWGQKDSGSGAPYGNSASTCTGSGETS